MSVALVDSSPSRYAEAIALQNVAFERKGEFGTMLAGPS